MFERNKIDNVEHSGVPVEITTDTGDVLKGRILIAMGRNIFEVLNSPGGFLEFEAYGGDRTYFAKGALRNVKLTHVPKVPNLKTRLNDLDSFDPHSILGLPSSASFDDVKAAWHRLSKTYHPDRYATAELPEEVADYLSSMARRVNAAYAALEAPHQVTRRATHARATPVFTSGQRG